MEIRDATLQRRTGAPQPAAHGDDSRSYAGITRIRFKGQLALSQPLAGHPSEWPAEWWPRLGAVKPGAVAGWRRVPRMPEADTWA
jgi:hypothetical protein